MKKITVFTPTYNRAYIITNLYNSLKKQDFKDFEWIIVDDGSTDNTKELVKKFIAEDMIEIKYFYQENSGKHIAINKGIEKAKGKLFFIVDSDDYLTDHALEIINKWENTLRDNIKEKFAGIGGLKGYNSKELIGNTFKGDYVDATSLERNKFNIKGDKAEVFYTEILKKYKFPKIENEKFISEAYIWNKIAIDGYKIRWFNEILIVCNYRKDGLTANREKLEEENPKGELLYLKQLIENEKKLIRRIAHYSSYCKIADRIYTQEEIKAQLNINSIKLYIFNLIYKLRKVWRNK